MRFIFMTVLLILLVAGALWAPPPQTQGLVIKAVLPPLSYSAATGTLSCPNCVAVDSTGGISLMGGVKTGMAGSKPTALDAVDANGNAWCFQLSVSGTFPTQGVPGACPP